VPTYELRAVGVAREPAAARPPSLDAVAGQAHVHPDLVRRFVRLGLPLDAAAADTVARAMRLRRDLAVNYAGALLACELLDRIEALESRLGRYERRLR
jgi:hypothetical protein